MFCLLSSVMVADFWRKWKDWLLKGLHSFHYNPTQMTFKIKQQKLLVSINHLYILWCINYFTSRLIFTYNSFHWNCIRLWIYFRAKAKKVLILFLLMLLAKERFSANSLTKPKVLQLVPQSGWKSFSITASKDCDFKLNFASKSTWLKFLSSYWT